MKRLFTVVLVCLLVGVALVVLIKANRTGSTSQRQELPGPEGSGNKVDAAVTPKSLMSSGVSASASPTPQPSANSPATGAQNIATQAGQGVVDANATIAVPPEIVLQNIRRAVRQYGEMFGGNPVGTNPEITAALSGNNPKHINFLNGQPGMRINQNGELVDAWGTPYFFHQLSGAVMEIHCAGPDRIMWTSDDLITK